MQENGMSKEFNGTVLHKFVILLRLNIVIY